MSICIKPVYFKNNNSDSTIINKTKKPHINGCLLKKCNRKKNNLEEFNELFPPQFKHNPKTSKIDTKKEKPSNAFALFKMKRSGTSLKEKRKTYLSQFYMNNKKATQVSPPEFSLKLLMPYQVYHCPFQSGKSNYSTEVINFEYLSDNQSNIKDEEKKKFYKLFMKQPI